jgi:hypothetical protein
MKTLYKVMIPGNYYEGKYFDFGYRPVRILAESEQEALDWVLSNEEKVYEYFDGIRTHSGRRFVPKDVEHNIFIRKGMRSVIDTKAISVIPVNTGIRWNRPE